MMRPAAVTAALVYDLLEGRRSCCSDAIHHPAGTCEQPDVPGLAKTVSEHLGKTVCEQPPICIKSCSPMILMSVVSAKDERW